MSASGGVRLQTGRFVKPAGRPATRGTRLVGRDLARAKLRRRIPISIIPGIVVGAVLAALTISHVRVQLIDQGYARAAAVERQQELEEELRILTARARELRDPARLAGLAKEMGLARPQRVIALAPPDGARRP